MRIYRQKEMSQTQCKAVCRRYLIKIKFRYLRTDIPIVYAVLSKSRKSSESINCLALIVLCSDRDASSA